MTFFTTDFKSHINNIGTYIFIIGTVACACPLTSRRRFAKRKKQGINLASIYFRFFVPNQCVALYGIRNLLRYGISLKASMESRPKSKKFSLPTDAIRGQAAIPCNSLCELMPYTSPSVLNKTTKTSPLRVRFWLFLVDHLGLEPRTDRL